MHSDSFEFSATPTKIIDLWKLDEIGDPEYPVEAFSTTHVLRFNRTAAAIWRRIDGVATFDEIVADLCVTFTDTDLDVVREELAVFMRDLEDRMMIAINSDPLNGLE